MLLPKLIQLRLKLKSLTENDNFQYCAPLVSALLTGIDNRFHSFLDLDVSDVPVKHAILAAITHPAYKLKWVTPEKCDGVTQLFLDAVVRYTELHLTSNNHLPLVLDYTSKHKVLMKLSDLIYIYIQNNSKHW